MTYKKTEKDNSTKSGKENTKNEKYRKEIRIIEKNRTEILELKDLMNEIKMKCKPSIPDLTK